MATVVNEEDLKELSTSLRSGEKRIGLSTGVFDVLSPGVIEHLKQARKNVDVLIVGVISDTPSARFLFEHNQKERVALINAISYVDYVFVQTSENSVKAISELKPHFYIRGHVPIEASQKKVLSQEIGELETHGGRLLLSSNPRLTETHFIQISKELKSYLNTIDRRQIMSELRISLEKISKLQILVIGETIIDKYTMVHALGKSSKDPLLAFEIKETSTLPGGILSIADICSRWVKNVSVISYGRSLEDLDGLIEGFAGNLDLRICEFSDKRTIVKHRFVDSASDKKVFEYYDFTDRDLSVGESEAILKKGGDVANFDLVLVADYGHGLFTETVRDWLIKSSKYLVVNTQANAGNRGFNTISKYEKCDFFSLNSSELHLELRNQNPDYSAVVPEVAKKLGAKGCVLTLGGNGVMVFDESGFTHAPALARLIVDKVGAGDALFSISSLLACVGSSKELIALLGNIVAAFEVSQLGHCSSLSLADLMDCALSILDSNV